MPARNLIRAELVRTIQVSATRNRMAPALAESLQVWVAV